MDKVKNRLSAAELTKKLEKTDDVVFLNFVDVAPMLGVYIDKPSRKALYFDEAKHEDDAYPLIRFDLVSTRNAEDYVVREARHNLHGQRIEDFFGLCEACGYSWDENESAFDEKFIFV